MKRMTRIILLVCCVIVALETPLYAQVVIYPRGVRNIGMGTAGVADLRNPVNGYYNPAALAWSNGIFIESSYNKYLDVMKYSDLRISIGRSNGDILFGGLLGYSSELVGEDCHMQGGGIECEKFEDKNYYISGGTALGRRIGNYSVGVGVAVKHLDHYGYTSTVVDVGTIGAWSVETEDGYKFSSILGASVRNVGKDFEVESDFGGAFILEQFGESRVGIGINILTPVTSSASKTLGRKVSAIGIGVLFDVIKGFGSNQTTGAAFGTEVSIFETIFMRAGSHNEGTIPYNMQYINLGFGIGWRHPEHAIMIRLDYARVDYPRSTDYFYDENKYDHILGFILGKVF